MFLRPSLSLGGGKPRGGAAIADSRMDVVHNAVMHEQQSGYSANDDAPVGAQLPRDAASPAITDPPSVAVDGDGGREMHKLDLPLLPYNHTLRQGNGSVGFGANETSFRPSGSFVEVRMNELQSLWRWDVANKLCERDKTEKTPFASLTGGCRQLLSPIRIRCLSMLSQLCLAKAGALYSLRNNMEYGALVQPQLCATLLRTIETYQSPRRPHDRHDEDDDEDDAHTLKERLLFLETRLHKRTKFSRRNIRLLVAFLAFVLFVAIALSVALGVAIIRSETDPVDTTCIQTFYVTSVASLDAFASLGCTQVGGLVVNGSYFTASPPNNMTFPSLTIVTNTVAIVSWNETRLGPTSLSFPALVQTGGLLVQDAMLTFLRLPALLYAGNVRMSVVSFVDGLDFPKLTAAASLAFDDVFLHGELGFPALGSVSGNITLHATRTTGDLFFPVLEFAGLIDIEGPLRETGDGGVRAPEIRFPSLANARGIVVFNIPFTGGVFFPRLKEIQFFTLGSAVFEFYSTNGTIVKHNFDIHSLESASFVIVRATFGIPSIQFSSLKRADTMSFDGNTFLEHIDFPVLETVGDLYFGTNTNLVSVSFDALTIATQGLRFIGHSALREVSAPSLFLGVLLFSLNTVLETISFPVLLAGSMVIAANSALTYVEFPQLLGIGLASFFQNTALESISMPALMEMSERGWVYEAGPSSLYWVIAQSDILGLFNVSFGISVGLFDLGRVIAGGSFSAFGNDNLTSINLGGVLDSGNTIIVSNNPMLCPGDILIPSSAVLRCGCAFSRNGIDNPSCNMSVPAGGGAFTCPAVNRSSCIPRSNPASNLQVTYPDSSNRRRDTGGDRRVPVDVRAIIDRKLEAVRPRLPVSQLSPVTVDHASMGRGSVSADRALLRSHPGDGMQRGNDHAAASDAGWDGRFVSSGATAHTIRELRREVDSLRRQLREHERRGKAGGDAGPH